MFQDQASVVVSDGIDTPRARKTRRRRGSRDPNRPERYEARKLAGVCTTCGRPTVPDRQMCAQHLDAARVATRRAMRKRRKELHSAGLCTNGCGRPSTSWRCFVCAVRAGETPGFSPAESAVNEGVNAGRDLALVSAIHRETVVREVVDDAGHSRTRFHGSGKRGGANQTAFVVDGQDLRYAKAALEKAIAGMVAAEAPDVKALPRIQRLARRREWQAFADLARRHLDEMLERGGYDRDDT